MSYGIIIQRITKKSKGERIMQNPLIGNMQQQQPNNILQRFQQFQRMFKGDPQKQVQELLNSGKVSQAQYNNAVQMANQLQRIINAK